MVIQSAPGFFFYISVSHNLCACIRWIFPHARFLTCIVEHIHLELKLTAQNYVNLYNVGWGIFIVCRHRTEQDGAAGKVGPHYAQNIFNQKMVPIPGFLHHWPAPKQGNHSTQGNVAHRFYSTYV